MTDALEDHGGTVSIGGRTITNLRYADDIDGLAGEDEELANLVERLDKASTAYSMEISAKKTKLMTNSTSGSKPEILSRTTQTTDRSISLSFIVWLMLSLITSIFLYACESWTLTAELQRRIQAMEMRCYRKILHISYKDMLPTRKSVPRSSRQLDHTKTTWWSWRDANSSGMVMFPVHQVWPKPSCKAQWKGEGDKADKGRGGKTTSGNCRPGVQQVPEGSGEQEKMEKTGCKVICGAPTTLAVKRLMMMMISVHTTECGIDAVLKKKKKRQGYSGQLFKLTVIRTVP